MGNDSSRKKFWNIIANIVTFKEEKCKEGFVLNDEGNESSEGKQNKNIYNVKTKNSRTNKVEGNDLKKPKQVHKTQGCRKKEKYDEGKSLVIEELFVEPNLKTNKEYLDKIYSLSKNKDIIIREFYIALDPPLQAFVLFIDGLCDKNIINGSILKPLMVLLEEVKEQDRKKVPIGGNIAEYIRTHLLPGHDVRILDKYRDILDNVNFGGTALFIEGSSKCLVVETKGWDRRTVGRPEAEQVIMGPHEAFNETLRSNTGLIRKALRNEKLITEMVKAGSRNNTDVGIMYLEDLANPKLVDEVKRRITSIKTDYVGAAGVLEQFIEEDPFMISPQVLTTERPDRVVSFLVEGHVAIIIDGGPQILVVPITLFSLLHSPEDYYLRMPYGNFLRLLRIAAIFIAMLTPGIYVSVVNFHQEMIPTELLLAIAASHVTVPYPTIFEVFAMEFSFELIREAGVRVPGVIGNTIGIVGGLILGQAAVQAGIISPILIIVIAVTGLASFAIPNYSLSFGLRGIRFVFTILAAIFGFFGISGGLFLLLISLVSMKSFGVPFLAPIAPKTRTEPDVVLRGPVWSMEERVDYLEPLDRHRQPEVSRGWIKKPRGGRKNEE
ncbi:MAG: spore germination protein [Clostridia bacterium]|nr:spore germination protein [Clostridia bacterium]MDD4048574.1 spore germination protein [Clostridia bacterium]